MNGHNENTGGSRRCLLYPCQVTIWKYSERGDWMLRPSSVSPLPPPDFFSPGEKIYLFARLCGRRRDRESIFYRLVHSPHGHRLKSGVRNALQVSRSSLRGPSTCAAFMSFLGALAGSWFRSPVARSQTFTLVWHAGVASGGFTWCPTALTPSPSLL